MEPITIILIVYSLLTTLAHGYRLKSSKCRTGNANSCCEFDTEIIGQPSTAKNDAGNKGNQAFPTIAQGLSSPVNIPNMDFNGIKVLSK